MSTQLVEFDQLKAQVITFVAPTADIVVTDTASNSVALGVLKTIKDFTKQIEERRKTAVRPLNDQVKEINDYAKAIAEPLDAAEKAIKKKMADFAEIERKRIEEERRKAEEARLEAQRKAEEERKRIEEEAKAKREAELKRLKEEQEAKAAELAKKQKEEQEALAAFGVDEEAEKRAEEERKALEAKLEQVRIEAEQKLEQERIAEEARIERENKASVKEAKALAKSAEASRPKNVREVPRFEVIEALEVPQEFWIIDQQALGAAVRAGRREIPGVRIWMETTIVAR